MDRSPKGREIERVEGNPGDIIARGEDITALGTKMLDCADTLETIKNEAVGDGSQKGMAIEKLKESIGDSFEKLREAGELYKPVGPVITAYGNALDGCKPTINNSADDCEDKWAIYDGLPGDENGSTTPEAGGGVLGMGGYDADSPEAKQKAEDNAAKKAAFDDWRESAEAFDGGYDTWEEAFDTAVNNIGDAMSGKIKDSFWGDLASVLEIAVLIIGVVALIVGGPLMAVIALVAGVILAAVTLAAYLNGERSGTDLSLSILGAIPFAKVTAMTKLANLGSGSTKTILRTASGIKGLEGAGKQASKLLKGQQILNKGGLVALYKNRGPAAAFKQLFTGSPNGFKSFYRGQKKMYEGLEYAGSRTLSSVRTLARIDQAATLFSTTSRNLLYLNIASGGDTPKVPKTWYFKVTA